ncbi:MAG: 3-phosphoshikimate 1-carboxyvinyltransferase [Bacteroidales bacterium]|nr:3-phosphoshikimate 1-carboxyvinyltransferase [Bacteroidales bacterium]
MKKCVLPSAVNGSLVAPPSKSVAQRAIAIASLCSEPSFIYHAGRCDDVLAAIEVARALGASISEYDHVLEIKGGVSAPKQVLQCGESGLCARMFAGVAATLKEQVCLTGSKSLLKRSMAGLQTSLIALGVQCTTTEGHLPVCVTGPLKGGEASIDASQSSQVLTGILIGAPYALSDVRLNVVALKSKPYADLTVDIMRFFGAGVQQEGYRRFVVSHRQPYRGRHFRVEGDWSSAAFMLVAGAIAGSVTVRGINPGSFQADKQIVKALRDAGAVVSIENEQVRTEKKLLNAFCFDATDCPDLFPPLAVLAANCAGTSRIKGTERLRDKESDRAQVLSRMLSDMGVSTRIEHDTMLISGGPIRGILTNAHGDHRMAMAAAISALNACGPVEISGAECVKKSYPGFFNDLEAVSAPKQ